MGRVNRNTNKLYNVSRASCVKTFFSYVFEKYVMYFVLEVFLIGKCTVEI